MRVVGIVLAAGAGRRMGAPKALLRRADGTTFVSAAAELLRAAGCAEVLVTVGARAEDVRAELPVGVVAVDAPDFSRGQGAGLARALDHPLLEHADAVLVTLVDLPRVELGAIRSVLALAGRDVLARGVDGGLPGHPVLIGRDHLAAAIELARTGSGLKELLASPSTVGVEVPGAVADVDRPEDLPPGTRLP